YCDWYIEMSKIRVRAGESPSPLPVLAHVLERVLRLLHPFLPFVTEEIWQTLQDYLPKGSSSPAALIVAPYPQADRTRFDDQAEREIEAVVELTRAARNVRAVFRVANNLEIAARVATADDLEGVFRDSSAFIQSGAGVELSIAPNADALGQDGSEAVQVLGLGTLGMTIGDLVDLDSEKARLQEELEELRAHRKRLAGRLGNEQFVSKAPEEVVEKERDRLADVDTRVSRLADILDRLAS
ncbi:MAG TPA: valine--tRNA ligase, partial [Dehalococcoidia bacterium]|nr:valine--tRNA ligase [Dehalococcoidia bacterium]